MSLFPTVTYHENKALLHFSVFCSWGSRQGNGLLRRVPKQSENPYSCADCLSELFAHLEVLKRILKNRLIALTHYFGINTDVNIGGTEYQILKL